MNDIEVSFMENIRTYFLGPSLIFPYFSSTVPIVKALILHNERFFYAFCLTILIIIMCIINFMYLKKNNTLLIYTVSLILIVSAFSLQRSYEARQGLLLKESIFSRNQNMNLQTESIEQQNETKQMTKERQYFRTFDEFKMNLTNEFDEKTNLDISMEKYFLDLEIKMKEIFDLINKLNENWNQFLKESQNISNKLKALDISIELYNLEFQQFLQNVKFKYKILHEQNIKNIIIPNSRNTLFFKQNEISDNVFNKTGEVNKKNNVIVSFINNLIFIFFMQLIICFIAFLLDSNQERILWWIRCLLFILCILELFFGLICMIYAHIGEKLCLGHDLNSCKTDSTYRMDDIINIINGNRNEILNTNKTDYDSKLIVNKQTERINTQPTKKDVANHWFNNFKGNNFLSFALSPNIRIEKDINTEKSEIEKNINIDSIEQIQFIKKEFEIHREQIQSIISLLKKTIEYEIKEKIGEKQIIFNNFFDKIKYLEPDFDSLIGTQINKENYYNLIQSIKAEISSIVLIADQQPPDLLNNLIKYVKLDEFFKNSLDSLKMYVAGSSIVNQENYKRESEKCNNSIKLVCIGANRINELFLLMMGFGLIFSIMLCF